MKFSFNLFGKTCKAWWVRHHTQDITCRTDCSGAKKLSYNTKQSKMVFDILLENKDRHLTADEIFESLKEKGESVGKTTVYRHLEKLCASGEVRKFAGGDGDSACYQYAGKNAECREHYHLKCTECGKLIHAECNFLSELSAHIYNEHGFKIDGSRTVLYGVCGDCLKKERQLHK